MIHDVVIVGYGPAGYTAAIYAARAQLSPVVLAGSVTAGGALMNTTEVENYPGFIDGIMGPQLMTQMQEQAERFGADVRYEDVTALELTGDVKRITTDDAVYEARAVIISTGSESAPRSPSSTDVTSCAPVPSWPSAPTMTLRSISPGIPGLLLSMGRRL